MLSFYSICDVSIWLEVNKPKAKTSFTNTKLNKHYNSQFFNLCSFLKNYNYQITYCIEVFQQNIV